MRGHGKRLDETRWVETTEETRQNEEKWDANETRWEETILDKTIKKYKRRAQIREENRQNKTRRLESTR